MGSSSPVRRLKPLEFDQVHYIAEVRTLLKTLSQHVPNQLYLCWGGMVALNYFLASAS